MIETVERRLVYENAYLQLFDDVVRFPDGHEGTYCHHRWKAPYGVGVVAVALGAVLLVRSYRYADARFSLEIPLGFGIEGRGHEEQARVELREETGLEATRLTPLLVLGGSYRTHVYVAEVDHPERATVAGQERTESIEGLEWVPVAELTPAALAARGIYEPISVAALLAARPLLGNDDLL